MVLLSPCLYVNYGQTEKNISHVFIIIINIGQN